MTGMLAQAQQLAPGEFALLASSAAALYIALRFASRAASSDQAHRLWLSTWPMAAVAVTLVLIGRESAAILLCVASSACVLTLGLAVAPVTGLAGSKVSRRVWLLLPVLVVMVATLRLGQVELVHATVLLLIGVIATRGPPPERNTGAARVSLAGDAVALAVTLLAVGLVGVSINLLDRQYRMPSDTVMAAFILAPVVALTMVMDELQRTPAKIAAAREQSSERVDAAVAFTLRAVGVILPMVLLIAAARPRLRTWFDLPAWAIVATPLEVPASAMRFAPLLLSVALLLLIYRVRDGKLGKPEAVVLIAGYVVTLMWSLV